MIILIIGIGLLLLGLGFIITESNAPYLLSGYNTLSDEDKKDFNLTSFITFNKRFHIALGLSTIVIGLIIFNKWPDNSIIFISIYPILAYVYFIWETLKFYKKQNKTIAIVSIALLCATVLGVSTIFFRGMKPTELIITKNEITFTGSYGETITAQQIKNIDLVQVLPKTKFKSNGFATNKVKKGYFKTESGEKIKLLLTNAKAPYLEITKVSGDRIFFQTDQLVSPNLLYEIQSQVPLSNE